MDPLFAKYEQELVSLRALCREYAQRYPKVAARLQLGGEACDDPHVERLIQAVALLSARVSKRLDDAYPQFTEALLNLLFPHYLRPFPSCAIARVATPAGAGPLKTIARGTRLETRTIDGLPCTFTTAYALAPIGTVLAEARFEPVIDAPPALSHCDAAGAGTDCAVDDQRCRRHQQRLTREASMHHQGRAVIRLNDKTDHGGQVTAVSSGTKVMGVEAALAGDMSFCPKCKGNFPLEPDGAGARHMGRPYAYDGDVTACGAKLIASL